MEITRHDWKNEPQIRTVAVRCLLCDDEAVAVFYAPYGCTCAPNKIQPRCMQHMVRAYDTEEEMHMLEDFRIKLVGDSQ